MQNLDRRIAELEKHNKGCDDRFTAIIVSFVRPGPNGPIEDEPTGYTSDCGANVQRWDRLPGEVLEDLQARAKRGVSCAPGSIPRLLTVYD